MLNRFRGSRRGSVSVMAATMLPAVIALAGLVTEYGDGLMIRAKTQRIADAAAYSGAITYAATNSTSSMNDAVSRIATLNGIASASVTPSLVNSPTGDGNQAVLVTVVSSVPLGLAKVLGGASSVSVTTTSYAEVKSNGNACVIALASGGTGVTLSGGTNLQAPGCAVAANATPTSNPSEVVPNGTSMTTPLVIYNSTNKPCPTGTQCNIHPPTGTASVTYTKKVTSDPLSTSPTVTAETSHLSSVGLIVSPSAPNPPTGTPVTFGWSPSNMTVGGCTARLSSGTWTVTCTGSGPFNFGKIQLAGGITVNFTSSSSATFNVSDNIDGSSGAAINFGPGTYNISGGIIVGGGMTMTFGAGTFNIGKLTSTCNSAAGYSICNNGTALNFAGPSTFVMAGGIYNSGGSSLTLGTTTVGNTSPTTNSFNIGKANDGNSLVMGGGAKTTFADASGTGDLFQMAGNLTSSGGSCLVISAAAAHDINGSINAAGGTYLGAGAYSVTGYVALGAGGGGDVTCTVNGISQSLGMSGTNVGFGIGASSTPGSGSCANAAFCVAAGYGHVTLTAPTSGSLSGLVVMGPTTSTNSAGAIFAEGSSNTSLSGVFYLPYGPVTLSGAANVGNSSGQCLELIGSQVSLTGGSALASTCTGLGGNSATTIVLVQ